MGEQGYTLNEMNLEGVRVKLVQLVAADGFKHSEMRVYFELGRCVMGH